MDRSKWELLPLWVAASSETNPVMPLSKNICGWIFMVKARNRENDDKRGIFVCAKGGSLFEKHLGLVLLFCTIKR